MLNESKNDELMRVLVHAGADTVLSRSGGTEKPDVGALTKKAAEIVSTLKPLEAEALLARLRFYEILLSKDVRREMRGGDTPLAEQARAIRQDVRSIVDAMLGDETSSIRQATHAAITEIVEVEQSLTLPPEALCQQLIGEDFEQIKTIAGKPKADKWIDLVAPLFTQGKAIDVLNEVGFIPYQTYESKTFRNTVHFSHLSALHRQLREREEHADGIELERTLHARSQLLCHVFLQEKAEGIGGKVTLDTNGLWVNLEDRRKKAKEPDRLVGHIPYGYIDESLIEALLKQERIQEGDALELRLRHAEATNDVVRMDTLEERKIRTFLEVMGGLTPNKDEAEQIQSLMDKISFAGVQFANYLEHAERQNRCMHFPLSLIRSSLLNTRVSKGNRLQNILSFAESIQSYISKQTKNVYRKNDNGYDSYDLSRSAQESYEHRKNIIHDPRNYDVPRIIGVLLENKGTPPENASVQYNLFRGTIQEYEGHTHSFIEIVVEGARVSRILLDPEKQLSATQKILFEQLPELNKNEYELFDTLSNSYYVHHCVINDMREIFSPRWDTHPHDSRREFYERAMEKMNAFLLMEDPERYAEAAVLYGKFVENNASAPNLRYFALCEEAVKEFGKRLFKPERMRETLEQYSVNIQRHKVTFDDEFVNTFPERFKEKSWTWDASLCTELKALDYSVTVVDAGERVIPYAMEAKAIRSLRLLQDRPLISVIGGCRDMPNEGSTKSAVQEMCEGIVHVADKLTANVVPPGTQSGIGISLSKVSVAYDQRTLDRSPAKKARFFAVSPGGETYYPGNTHMADESEHDAMVYAIGPFDSILTPFQAGWDWKGDRKRNAPYFQHVEYAEAIYQRVSAGQPRVTVVGNGGLFTVVEAAAALKNHASILLIADTGRFADLAIALERHRAKLPEVDKTAWEKAVLEIIRSDIPAHSTKSLLSAFGEDTPSAEQQLYRDKVFEYFLLGKGENVRIGGVTTVEQDIETIVAEKREKSFKKPT